MLFRSAGVVHGQHADLCAVAAGRELCVDGLELRGGGVAQHTGVVHHALIFRQAGQLDVTLSTDEHMLTVEQTTDYLNPAGKNLSEIYFNIYPEAFSADGGGAAVQSIKLNGSESQLENVKGTVFKAVLASPLAADERCRIEIRYSVRIPNIKNQIGRAHV